SAPHSGATAYSSASHGGGSLAVADRAGQQFAREAARAFCPHGGQLRRPARRASPHHDNRDTPPIMNPGRTRARALGGEAAVYTFEPHPRKVLQPERAPRLLTTLEQK